MPPCGALVRPSILERVSERPEANKLWEIELLNLFFQREGRRKPWQSIALIELEPLLWIREDCVRLGHCLEGRVVTTHLVWMRPFRCTAIVFLELSCTEVDLARQWQRR